MRIIGETRTGYVSLAEAGDAWNAASTSLPGRQASSASESTRVNDEAWLRRYRKTLSIGYFLAMGVSGLVLRHLATEISAVFLTRSFGCLLGALVSTHLYGKMRKNTVIYLSLQALMAVVASLPFITSEWTLHVTLLAAGFFASIVDTGCQIMTQRLYGAKAGHYLGANVLAYSVSGACVPVIAYVTDSFVAQYAVVAAMTGAIGVLIFLPPAPETLPGVMEEIPELQPTFRGRVVVRTLPARWRTFYERYQIEFCIGAMVFWIVGGKAGVFVSASNKPGALFSPSMLPILLAFFKDGVTSLLKKYIISTRKGEGGKEHLLVEWLWLAFVTGRLVGLLDILCAVNLSRLRRQLAILLLFGAAGAVAIAVLDGSRVVLWAGVAAYGFSNGPLCGYCNELYNRVALHSDVGVAMVVFGMNAGSMMPYLFSLGWELTSWPASLFVMLAASHLIPLLLLVNSKQVGKASKKTMSECDTLASLSDSADEEDSLLGTAPESQGAA